MIKSTNEQSKHPLSHGPTKQCCTKQLVAATTAAAAATTSATAAACVYRVVHERVIRVRVFFVRVCVDVREHVQVYMCVCVHVCMHICLSVCIYVYV